jgi:hypothetical protein
VGLLLQQQGRLMEAEEHLQRALALKPELTPASTLLAKIQRQRGMSPVLANSAPSVIPAPAAPVAAPAVPSTPAAPITPAGWTAARTSSVQPAGFAPPPGVTTPQQWEQWRNQQMSQ